MATEELNGLGIFRKYFKDPEDCKVTYGGFCNLATYTIPTLDYVMTEEDYQIVQNIGWKYNSLEWKLEAWS